MKSTKTFNNISDTLKAQIPKLKKGEIVVFQMLNGVPNPEPDEKEKSKQGAVLYGKRQLVTYFKIYDEHLKDESGKEIGGFVEVGCVDVWHKDQPERFRTFIPGLGVGGGSFFQGKFQLEGGKVSDEELFETLWLSPERKGCPCPDSSVEQMFEIVNIKAEGQKTLSKVDTLYEVLGVVKKASEKEMQEYMASVNQPIYTDPEVLKAKVSELAKNDPEAFLKSWNSGDKKQKAIIKQAFDLSVLSYENDKGEIKMGNVTITKLKVEDMADVTDSFNTWVKSARNGKEVIENITNQVAEKEKVAETSKK
jgi:hypothetical protein